MPVCGSCTPIGGPVVQLDPLPEEYGQIGVQFYECPECGAITDDTQHGVVPSI